MVKALVHYFYPDLQQKEIRRFGWLAAIFALIIGAYWMLRLLKTTIFLKVAFPTCLGWAPQQGCLFQPIAKFWSPFVVLGMVLIYSKLVDIVKKHQLFYIFCALYAFLFTAAAVLLFINDTYGAHILGKTALAIMGWSTYFLTESFGSLVVALFWSFTSSITSSEAAKRGYPFIFAAAQLSAIISSSALFFSGSIGALWPILLFAGCLVIAVIPCMHYFVKTTPEHELTGDPVAAQTEKEKDGFFKGFVSGIMLLCTRSYLLGVLIISTVYEAISQIIEYQMNAYASMSPAYQTDLAFAGFQSMYGVGLNVVSFLIALLGTSYLLRKFGVRIGLLVYPAIVGLVVVFLLLFFQFSPSVTALLWATFGAMIVIKGAGYAVNTPTKEMMYIPTSKDAKFKSKGWIDTFGSRFAKAGGSRVTNAFKYSFSGLMMYGSLISLGLVGIWVAAAIFVGYKNKLLTERNEIIE